MRFIRNELKPLHIGQLESEIRAVFDKGQYLGLSTDQKGVSLFVIDDLSDDDEKAMIAIYDAHAPEETDEQAEQRKRGSRKNARTLLKQFKRAEIRSLAEAMPYLEALIHIVADD